MAYPDPKDAFEHLKTETSNALKTHFPIVGKTHTVHLRDFSTGGDRDPHDIRGQQAAKADGKSFSTTLFGHLELVENGTGKVVDSRKLPLLELPQMTNRYSYIVGGKEYQVANQWQSRPGAYTRRGQDGILETQFNVVNRLPFTIALHPESGEYKFEYKSANLPVYPFLKALGVDDAQIADAIGRESLEIQKKARNNSGALAQFYKTSTKQEARDAHEAAQHFATQMSQSKLDPHVTKHTLGAPMEHVTGDTLLRALSKLQDVHNGAPEDDKDSLVFKSLRGVGDYAADKIRAHGVGVRARVNRQINKTTDLRQVIPPGLFNAPLRATFTDNAASELASQINPVEMLGKNSQTTVLGPGGITSERAILDSVKFINNSHLGFQDTVVTPESGRTGVNLRLPLGLVKDGNDAKISVYNLKKGAHELVDSATFVHSNVVLPDQVKWVDGKPVPYEKKVRVAGKGNDFTPMDFDKAHYVMSHPSQLYSVTTNLIPFLANVSGNRASMATRHIEQAISLVNREPPLVQAATGSSAHGASTFDELVGRHSSHVAPVSGKVVGVKEDGIHIQGPDGKTEVQIYNHFPLNDAKSTLHSTPLVKVGDEVKKGQVIADTNYTKNGVLALGSNLRVGYLAYKGYNFEDGLVISESAAKHKLASKHLYKEHAPVTDKTVLDKKKFFLHLNGVYQKDQLQHIGDDGVVTVGSKVRPGDPLVLAMQPYDLRGRADERSYHKALQGSHVDKSVRWDGSVDGVVTSVHRTKDGIQVHVSTVEPMRVGDKLSSKNANKGVVSMIVPDHEMPHTKDGQPLEILMNPSGVPGRLNPSQILETAAGKIAKKTGKTYVVPNFQHAWDAEAHVRADLKKHGLTDTEEVIDPLTGHSLGPVMVGYQHVLKLVHQADKKVSVTSGMSIPGVSSTEAYDSNLQSKSGQRLGSLGTYALLAHGAVHNLREFQTFKGEGNDPETDFRKKWHSQHQDVWNAIQTGSPLPIPKTSFAFHKFTEMLKASGINVEKKGHELITTPLTDKHVLELTGNRVITKPGEMVYSKLERGSDQLKPKPGGLFDESLTGGHNGKRWSRIPLAEPMPNPIFEAPIKALTKLTTNEFQDILHGSSGVNIAGKVVPHAQADFQGGKAIEYLLKKIDVPKELEHVKSALATMPAEKIDREVKTYKYLNALHQIGMKPDEAYIMKNVAVLPPAFRPISVLGDGKNISNGDTNELYKRVGLVNDQLRNPDLAQATDQKNKLRKSLYENIRALSGDGIPYDKAEHKGLLHLIAGSSPKQGLFQKRVGQKRQDLSMAAVITPEPALGLDQVGMPEESALKLFRPFVVKKAIELGFASNPLDAQKVVAKGGQEAMRALQHVVNERPVLLKRDPSLHKYSIQGFDVKLVKGNTLKLHPLVCSGFTADFDGDVMRAYVPISAEAVQEAHAMKPTNNLFSEGSGKVMYVPSLDSALGLYNLSLHGQEIGKKYTNPGAILKDAEAKHIKHTDIVELNGKKTTAGRVLLASVLPDAMQHDMLHNIEKHVDGKELTKLYTRLGKEHKADFDKAANALKDLGNHSSFGVVPVPGVTGSYVPVGAHTISLSDLTPLRSVRDPILAAADKDVAKIRKEHGTSAVADAKIIERYQAAEREMEDHVKKLGPLEGSSLHKMYKAGVKPGWQQYKQLVFAPLLFPDSAGRISTNAVKKNYTEGLDVEGYWAQMHGARKGSVQKVQEVQDPGALTKSIMQSTMSSLVADADCGTKRGVLLHVGEPDVHDRVLAHEYASTKLKVPAGSLLDSRTVAKIHADNPNAKLLVRSPLRCEHGDGICQQCAGLSSNGNHHPIGTNLGVVATQTLGERSVQLMLKSFHSGGVVAQNGSKVLGAFDRLDQLTSMPKKITNEATLAMKSGVVQKIDHTPTGVNVWVDNKKHFVGKDAKGGALHQSLLPGGWEGVRVGMEVKAGDHLSDPARTIVNPHRLYEATKSIESVQNYMTDQLHGLYKEEGVKRRHIETVVRNLTNLTRVVDPGGASGVVHGEFKPLSAVNALNKELQKAGHAPIEHTPTLRGVDQLPFDQHDDWLAKLQHQRIVNTLTQAAATGSRSQIHGANPIPGLAYGAEFGLNEMHSNRPGLKHLQNVKRHHY